MTTSRIRKDSDRSGTSAFFLVNVGFQAESVWGAVFQYQSDTIFRYRIG